MKTADRRLSRRNVIQIVSAGVSASLGLGCDRTDEKKNSGVPAAAKTTSNNSDVAVSDRVPPATQPYVEIGVCPSVRPIRQPSDNSCWAAVWTMMLSWKEGKLLSVPEAVARLGAAWTAHFKNDEGLQAQTYTETEFLAASGLKAKPPANYISSVYVELLASHGPLWINTGNGILNHATLLVSAQTGQDGRIDFRFADPTEGTFVTKSDIEFFIEFEREARWIVDQNLKWDFRFQVFYW